MTATVPCLLHAWQHALSQFVLYTKKGIFYLSHFATRLPGLWRTAPGPKIDPLGTLGAWAKFHGRPFLGSGCARGTVHLYSQILKFSCQGE